MTVTEAEWMACQDTSRMLKSIGGRASERKLRLFGVACCRRVGLLLADERSRQAVEAAERYTEGAATRGELLAAWEAAVLARGTRWEGACPQKEDVPANAAAWCAYVSNRGHASAGFAADGVCRFLRRRDALFHADCLRCIFGNPFRPLTLDPIWLTWHDGLLVSMAQRMCDSRDFSGMPVLADALEEAGCQDPDILGHCRSGGEHVRGCWVVDLLLGRS
jgi:hypothetical protein